MFKELFELMSDRDMISITLTKINDKLSVSVIPNKSGLKDEAKTNLHLLSYAVHRKNLKRDLFRQYAHPCKRPLAL